MGIRKWLSKFSRGAKPEKTKEAKSPEAPKKPKTWEETRLKITQGGMTAAPAEILRMCANDASLVRANADLIIGEIDSLLRKLKKESYAQIQSAVTPAPTATAFNENVKKQIKFLTSLRNRVQKL